MVSIRVAEAADANIIADLSRQTFYETFHEFNSEENMKLFMDEQFTKEKLREEFLAANNFCLLAYDDEMLAGYAFLKCGKTKEELLSEKACELARFYIVKESIGKGTAAKLMQQTLQFALTQGHEAIWLGVWEHNARAIRFYEKWSFSIFGKHEFVLGKDVQTDLLMKRKLDQEHSSI